jgi:hypothetical protein
MNMGEYDFEPIRGLPAELPPGERLLWQGSPSWWALARRAMRVLPVGAYFVVLAAWRASAVLAEGQGWPLALRNASLLLLLGALAVGVLCLLAWLAARATVYSITSARVLIRHGIALPMTLNLPFTKVHSASLRTHPDGTGEIALELMRGERIGYFLTWPHVRPFHFLQPQPSLRAIPGAQAAADTLEGALLASTAQPRSSTAAPTPAPGPAALA